MRFNSSRKTWITAGAILALLSFVLGLLFHFKLLDLSASVIVVVGILFLASLFLVIVSIRAWNSGSRLKKWLSRIYLTLFTISFILLSAIIAIIYNFSIYFQTIHDFYFCSQETIGFRLNKWEGLLDRQFRLFDEMPDGDRYKADILASLGYTYYSYPSDDMKNHLRLSRFFLKKAKSRFLKLQGSYPKEFIDSALAEIETKLGEDLKKSKQFEYHAPPEFDESKLMDKENKQN